MKREYPHLMSSPKSLSPEQISQIQAWADDGDGFPEIQKKLRDEFEVRITYLETRFLLEDLKIELKPAPALEPEPELEPDPEVVPGETGVSDEEIAGEDHSAEDGNVTAKVSIDALLRPGAIISGKVDFGGGHVASWWLDQMGRLGMDPIADGFRPSEAQVLAFQEELRAVVQKSGL